MIRKRELKCRCRRYHRGEYGSCAVIWSSHEISHLSQKTHLILSLVSICTSSKMGVEMAALRRSSAFKTNNLTHHRNKQASDREASTQKRSGLTEYILRREKNLSRIATRVVDRFEESSNIGWKIYNCTFRRVIEAPVGYLCS